MAWKRTLLLLLATVGAFLLVVVFTPVVPSIAEVSEPEWYSGGDREVLVILGGSMLVPGTTAQATLGYDSYLRCVYAVWLLRSEHFHYVVVSGGDGLAQAMAQYLVSNGVDRKLILTERSAMTTFENAVFTRRILFSIYGNTRRPSIVILTSDYHAGRAKRVFARNGMTVETIPVPDLIKRSASRSYRLTGAVTLISEWSKDFFYFVSGRI